MKEDSVLLRQALLLNTFQKVKFTTQCTNIFQSQVFWHYSSLFVFECTIYTGIYKAWKWITAQNTIEV